MIFYRWLFDLLWLPTGMLDCPKNPDKQYKYYLKWLLTMFDVVDDVLFYFFSYKNIPMYNRDQKWIGTLRAGLMPE